MCVQRTLDYSRLVLFEYSIFLSFMCLKLKKYFLHFLDIAKKQFKRKIITVEVLCYIFHYGIFNNRKQNKNNLLYAWWMCKSLYWPDMSIIISVNNLTFKKRNWRGFNWCLFKRLSVKWYEKLLRWLVRPPVVGDVICFNNGSTHRSRLLTPTVAGGERDTGVYIFSYCIRQCVTGFIYFHIAPGRVEV